MKILKRRERVTVKRWSLEFEDANQRGSGFSFPCDEQGNVFPLEYEAAKESLAGCLSGKVDGRTMIARGITECSHSHSEPAEGECNRCKRTVVLHGFTNTCECGVDYNMSGQELAPREQWGEETGESLSDILSIE